MLNKLREATQQLHKDIEGGNTAGLIIDHSITLEQYKKLLLQNFVAYKITEEKITKQIPTYSQDKTERLSQDLLNLKVDTSIVKDFENNFNVNTPAEAWGAWYVVEGSSLGGMIISKNIKECKALAMMDEHYFFSGKRQNVKGWKQYCKDLKSKDFSEKEEIEAINKAKETFQFFGRIFKEV
ncbi:heme oxygenase [Mesonia phycicola]|uniref:Heme oxygenase n=1 Tax=Mesonia phycicola TaxID=579105 RepID=A0A1M6ACD1_9FLAO|nr:biliverdin-producing heme oxygenase [Mesonia phycicola]SHI34146.1 heme oxygenase [Mesonia phycicola]